MTGRGLVESRGVAYPGFPSADCGAPSWKRRQETSSAKIHIPGILIKIIQLFFFIKKEKKNVPVEIRDDSRRYTFTPWDLFKKYIFYLLDKKKYIYVYIHTYIYI